MAEVVSRRSVVYDILFDVEKGKKSAKEAEKALSGIDKQSNKIEDAAKGLGKAFVAAFAVEKLLTFAKAASELADKAQAIRVAFDKLDGVSLVKLRAATGGAVDDIVLMQKAVQAANFKIPLGELEKLFRFATKRAKETGESVDVLVDSVVEGLGGGSARAFKALGISSDEFQRKVKQTGNTTKAVTELIDESFKKTGDSLEGLVDAGDKLDTSITNFQIAIGSLINDGFLDDFKDFLGAIIQLTTDLVTGQSAYNEELQKTRKVVQLTEEDVVNLFSAQLAAQEIGFKSYTNGAELTQEEQQKIIDGYREQAQAIINSTKVVEQETGKQADAIREAGEEISLADVVFDPNDPQIRRNSQKIVDNAFDEILKRLNERSESDFAIAPQIDLTELNAQLQELLKTRDELATFGEVVKDSATDISQSFSTIFGNLAQLSKDGSNAQIAFSIANIFAANAEALAKSIAAAASVPWPGNIPAIISSVATVTSLFASVNGVLSQARAAQASANAVAFAEGEVDIHRSGEVRGKDSINAVIMPGESVITTARTAQYKPVLEAIHAGSLDELIRVNYIEPALAMQALDSAVSGAVAPDYSDRFYRQYLATGEGNLNGKRMVRLLGSIDKKLSLTDKRYSR